MSKTEDEFVVVIKTDNAETVSSNKSEEEDYEIVTEAQKKRIRSLNNNFRKIAKYDQNLKLTNGIFGSPDRHISICGPRSTYDHITKIMGEEVCAGKQFALEGYDYLEDGDLQKNWFWAGSNASYDYFINDEDHPTILLIFVFFDSDPDRPDMRRYIDGFCDVRVIYTMTEEVIKISDKLTKFIYEEPVENEGCKSAQIITTDQDGNLDLTDNHVKPFEINFEKHYNDDIQELNEAMAKWDEHTDPNNRLCILYGTAGTGKTNWIKNYIQTIDREVIYVPPSMSHMISKPQFIDFLRDSKGALLIFEDAEQILEKRENTGDRGVSDILNLTDGMLADFLDLRIIATHNKNRDWIDPALQRAGRCYYEYPFNALTEDKSKSLCEELGVEWDGDEMTIAEIFNAKIPKHKKREDENRTMGFN